MSSCQALAKILRTKTEVLEALIKEMEAITGKKGVLDKIVEENQKRMDRVAARLRIKTKTSEAIYSALLYVLKKDDRELFDYFNRPTFIRPESYQKLIETALELVEQKEGFFLKREKAVAMLEATPPRNILSGLGYRDVAELIEKENLYEVFAALRFIESRNWMNKKFLPQYKQLTPGDFETRKIEVIVLSNKWVDLARDFMHKKYHNLSHLKEMGVVFIIPMDETGAGATLRLFSLLLHYLHEVPFYSKLIERYAREDNFTDRVISLLRGDVLEVEQVAVEGPVWLIVQRYLAKESKQDPRLFIPHVNPEALHWEKAEDTIAKLAKSLPQVDLEIWQGLDWVGEYYPSDKEGELLVSFDLIDNIMSLVMEKELVKYLYHHQEALWNKIFKEYVGKQAMEEKLIESFDRGVINLAG